MTGEAEMTHPLRSLIAERGAAIPEMTAGTEGVQLLETFRTALAL